VAEKQAFSMQWPAEVMLTGGQIASEIAVGFAVAKPAASIRKNPKKAIGGGPQFIAVKYPTSDSVHLTAYPPQATATGRG